MKEITLEEQKQIEFELLKYFKKVCEENNLKYFLAGGTLLGAVRHKGFIPWDDDIDVLMSREDYMKVLPLLENNEKYDILTPYNDEEYYYFFSKLVDKRTVLKEKFPTDIKKMGVYIDIFPIDGMPDDINEAEKYMEMLSKEVKLYFSSMIKWYYGGGNFVKKLMNVFLKFPHYLYCSRINYKKRKNKILELMKKYDYQKSSNVAFLLSQYKRKEIIDKGVYSEAMSIEFEGEMFSAPTRYKEYLTALYGDYMQLPPVEQRKSNHRFEMYWKE